jgi:GNAT superfamily N-acetyltransferase
VWENVPQPGASSGAPKQFGPDAKIQTKQMTVKEIIASIPGLPYYNNVVDDYDARDYSWGVTQKVMEYATYLKQHPESLANLPPILVLNGKFEDGAHRVSAIWLLQQRMDPKNPLWANAKLNVQFVKQGVAEDQVHEADASTVQFQTASTDNYQSSFTVTAIADGKNVGHFSFFRDLETDDVHNQAEVTDDVRGKGYGKALLLKAIEVANDHGLGFQEDSQSLSRAQSRVYDSLYDAGWIVDADGYWFLTPEGEQELARLSTIQQGVAEAPLADYVPMGDFNKPGPFRGADKKLVPHPVNQLKAQRFFEKTPYNFRLFFSNIPGTGKYSEYGVMDPDTVKIIFGDAGEQIVAGHEDAITVVYVGNSGDSKVMLTPWMMAHRLGHAMQSGTRGRSNNQQHPWKAGEDHFFGQVNSMLEEYYGKSGQRGGNLKAELTPEYNALFNAIGTQRSSRSGEIRRPYEFLYEIFAQYLGTGTVTFNALPANLGYGRKAWGNPSRYLNINPEYRDEAARKQATEVLSYDMELMFNDALSNAEGKILVM